MWAQYETSFMLIIGESLKGYSWKFWGGGTQVVGKNNNMESCEFPKPRVCVSFEFLPQC